MSDVRRLEDALAAAVRERDAAAARDLLADDFALTSSLGTGLHVEREEWLRALDEIETSALSARAYESRSFGDLEIVVWLMDWEARWRDDDLSGPYVVTDVWRDGKLAWRSWARLNAEFLQETAR